MQFQFQRAVKERAKLRLAFIGPAGSGKTYTALSVATHLKSATGRIAVVDTEHGSAAKYADLFDFDELQLTDFNPDTYVAAVKAAESAGYEIIILDSLSHAWAGPGGALELVDTISAKTRSGAYHHGWREVTPKHHALVEAMLQSPCHIIGTMRSKVTHIVEDGKAKKIGLQPVQRDGLEYEFDVVGDLEDIGRSNRLNVAKTRCSPLRGKSYENPGADFAGVLVEWLKGADPNRPKGITTDQLATITFRMPAWCKANGHDPERNREKAVEAWQGMLRANYGVGSAKNMTEQQAADLIGKLPTDEPKKEEPKPEPVKEELKAEVAEVSEPTSHEMLLTADQLAEIKRLAPTWMRLNSDQNAANDVLIGNWRKMLHDTYGVAAADKLTNSQAHELIGTLQACAANPTAGLFAPAPDATTGQAPEQQQPTTTPTAA